MSNNLLKNGGFEAKWAEEKSHRCLVLTPDGEQIEKQIGNVFTPPDWLTWFRHEPGTWDQPEVRDAWRNMDQRRVHSGEKGTLLFTFHRRHDAGFLQQVQVEPGTELCFTAWAHAWSNHPIEGHEDCTDNALCSCGVGKEPAFLLAQNAPSGGGDPWTDAIENVSFMVGIDPTGGTNPYADTVVWGPAAHIYNKYHKVPAAKATAQANVVTVFLRSRTQWAYKHNDTYWDTAVLTTAAKSVPLPDPPGGKSKLSIHIVQADGAGSFLDAGPPVIKFSGDWNAAANAPSNTLVIGAAPVNANVQTQRETGLTPREAAERFVSTSRSLYQANPQITYWEGFGEPHCADVDSLTWYTQFEIERIRLMSEMGLGCVIGNFATSAPSLKLWPAFLPAIEAGLEHEAILGLHEYNCPWMWWMTGKHQPEFGDDQEDEGWNTLRYRKLYRQYLLPNDLQIPLVITACGIHPSIAPLPPDAPAATWQGLGEYWATHDNEPDPADFYFRQLAWYDGELCKDAYVIGCTVSAWGDRDGQWREFDIAQEQLAEKLIQYASDYAPGPAAGPFSYATYAGEHKSSPPRTDDVPPRTSYRRTYILLPEIEDTLERLNWRVAAAIGSSMKMRTLGHSLDDAGTGPQERQIVAINPARWNENLEAWYNERYPGAGYEAIETNSPWEMAIQLLPALEDSADIALAQSDPHWAEYAFGEQPGPVSADEAGTIGQRGCYLTALAMVLRKVYRRAITPPMLDKLLVATRAAYIQERTLVWHDIVPLFPVFDEYVSDAVRRSPRQLADLLQDGWEIILKHQDGHAVYLEDVQGDVLHVIEPWDGERKKSTAAGYQGLRAARVRQMPSRPTQTRRESASESRSWVHPQDPFERSAILLPQIEDPTERADWRIAAAVGTSDLVGASESAWTIGHSADDAGMGPSSREIVAVNPAQWEGDLEAWFDEHYPSARYRPLETDSPWEMAIKLLHPLNEDLSLAQTDARWAGYDFGEHPDAGGETLGNYGCFLTGLAMILRRVYQRAATPPMLDKLLVAARSAYANDNLLMWEGVVPLFPAFDDAIKDNLQRSASELDRLLKAGWEVILRRADGGHFVYLDQVEGDVLHIIDTWDGKRKQKAATDYAGIRAAHVRSRGYPNLPTIMVGLHDETGGKWMAEHQIRGCCLISDTVQRQPRQFDHRHLQNAGITVICRLNWGYAHGAGTLPRPEDKQAFIEAVVQTMLQSRGISYFHVGNEPNNRSEWPGYNTDREFPLTAEYVTSIYNEIWKRVAGRAKLGPPPLDPYFGPHSNNREWWQYMLDHAAGADALFLHAKTQTNAPQEIWSRARFTDEPLTWQYLHLRTVETALAILPDRFHALPIFVTELNPQHLDTIEGQMGWRPDNAAWVQEALDYFHSEQPVTGVVFYRYEAAADQAPFGLQDKPAILDAVALRAREFHA